MDSVTLATFETLAEGVWREGEVEVTLDDSSRLEKPPWLEREIERVWQSAVDEAGRHNRLLFPGPLCRLHRFAVTQGRLRLHAGLTDYREYLGTNRNLAALRESFGEEVTASCLSNPLAVCTVVGTGDNALLVARRSFRTMEHSGFWHVVGGHVEPGPSVNVFDAVRKELGEELGVSSEEIAEMVCLGLSRSAETLKPELLFFSRLLPTWEHLCSRPNDGEIDNHRLIPDSREHLRHFLAGEQGRVVPIGEACLLRYERFRWG